jgi:hypothetical protein
LPENFSAETEHRKIGSLSSSSSLAVDARFVRDLSGVVFGDDSSRQMEQRHLRECGFSMPDAVRVLSGP